MKKENRQREMDKMYKSLTDPIKRQEAQRRTRIEKMLSDKKNDAGIC